MKLIHYCLLHLNTSQSHLYQAVLLGKVLDLILQLRIHEMLHVKRNVLDIVPTSPVHGDDDVSQWLFTRQGPCSWGVHIGEFKFPELCKLLAGANLWVLTGLGKQLPRLLCS